MDQHADSSRSMAASVKGAAAHAAEGAGELLHDAREAVVDGYRAGSEFVEHEARRLGERAGEVVDAVATQAVRTGRSTGRFMRSNALPLLMIGTGLGWLALRMLDQPRAPRHTARLTARTRMPSPPLATDDYDAPLSASTSSGQKLMGVRTHDSGYVG